jgi:hypothetical protein
MVKLRKIKITSKKDKNMENLISFGLQVLAKNPETIFYIAAGLFVYFLVSSIFTRKTYNAYSSKNIRKWG